MNKSIPSDPHRIPSHGATFAAVLGILAAETVISTSMGWIYSVDVRGWWPVILVASLFSYAAYAFAFSFVARIGTPFTLRFSAHYTLVLAAVLVAHTTLYYLARPDWLAVNNGAATLTFLQRIIFSHGTHWAILGLFLALATLRALQTRWRNKPCHHG